MFGCGWKSHEQTKATPSCPVEYNVLRNKIGIAMQRNATVGRKEDRNSFYAAQTPRKSPINFCTRTNPKLRLPHAPHKRLLYLCDTNIDRLRDPLFSSLHRQNIIQRIGISFASKVLLTLGIVRTPSQDALRRLTARCNSHIVL